MRVGLRSGLAGDLLTQSVAQNCVQTRTLACSRIFNMPPEQIPSRVTDLLKSVDETNIRFIKLGKRSAWWPAAKDTNTIRLGFEEAPFELCHSRDWPAVKEAVARAGTKTAQQATNQIRDFFVLDASTLWLTIEDGDVWWAFAEPGVTNLEPMERSDYEVKGARSRALVDRWRNVDLKGDRLRIDSMTTKVTKVTSFQGTICRPDGAIDILRRIRGEQSPARQRTKETFDQLGRHVGDLLDQLHQNDFELLIELIFSSSGWRRISATGGTMKTFDIVLNLPSTDETSFVQVKSRTDQKTLGEYIDALRDYTGYKRLFFAYHTPAELFRNPEPSRVTIWSRYEIGRQVLQSGLVEWVLKRTT